jgi:hypothetical protein
MYQVAFGLNYLTPRYDLAVGPSCIPSVPQYRVHFQHINKVFKHTGMSFCNYHFVFCNIFWGIVFLTSTRSVFSFIHVIIVNYRITCTLYVYIYILNSYILIFQINM